MEKHEFPSGVAIIVFAKTPDAPVKTRIARSVGGSAAVSIYRELLEATSASIGGIPYHVAYAGSDGPGELADYFTGASSFYPQTGIDLGARMKNACMHCLRRGYTCCIVIGCDCPDRTADEIYLAARHLVWGTDVVLGPVEDGGYQLAGVNEAGLRIFDATGWSTPQLMDETMAILRNGGLTSVVLPVRTDIDTVEDYNRWKQRRR